MGKRRRRRRDRADGLRAPCFASPLPPEIPRPAPRGVLRAAVGRSSDSWARRASLLPTSAASQGMAPQCWWRVRSQLPLRGSAGVARTRHRLPVLIPWLATTGTDGHNIVGRAGGVNTKCCVEQGVSTRCGFHEPNPSSPTSLMVSAAAVAGVSPCLIASVGRQIVIPALKDRLWLGATMGQP